MPDVYPQVVKDLETMNQEHGLSLRLVRRDCPVRLFDFYDGDRLIVDHSVSAGNVSMILVGMAHGLTHRSSR